jgi:hypothetical protein
MVWGGAELTNEGFFKRCILARNYPNHDDRIGVSDLGPARASELHPSNHFGRVYSANGENWGVECVNRAKDCAIRAEPSLSPVVIKLTGWRRTRSLSFMNVRS